MSAPVQPAGDRECLRQNRRPCQTSASPLRTDVRTKEKRLQKSAQAVTRDPPLSPGRSTGDIERAVFPPKISGDVSATTSSHCQKTPSIGLSADEE